MLKRMIPIALSASILLGCGVGANTLRRGSLRLAVAFPAGFRAHLVPAETHSVHVLVFSAGRSPDTAMHPPALMPSRERVTVPEVPIGAQIVLAAALDCQGRILTAARAAVNVLPAPAVTPVELELLTDFGTKLASNEVQALDKLVPECTAESPSPLVTATATPQIQPTAGSPSPTPSVTPTASVQPSPVPEPSPSPDNGNLQLELDAQEGGDRVIKLKTLLKGASGQIAQVARVEYFVNDARIAAVTTPPYPADWETNPRSAGSYRIKSVAYDASGRELAVSGTATILLLVRDQISVSSGSGGGGGGIVIVAPTPVPTPVPTPTPSGIDVGTPGGASFDASVTLHDGSPTLGPIAVDSP